MTREELLKQDLLDLDIREFYVKYIIKSYNWYFSDYLNIPENRVVESLDRFKEIVSENFHVSFHSLQMVGSAKTGFSLSPRKALKPFHDADEGEKGSDIDIAIISEKWFNYFWNRLRGTEKLHYKSYYTDITKSVFRGYINEKNLLAIESVRKEWKDLVAPINRSLQDELMIVHPITYRLYRSWEDLEEYQLQGIKKTKQVFEEV